VLRRAGELACRQDRGDDSQNALAAFVHKRESSIFAFGSPGMETSTFVDTHVYTNIRFEEIMAPARATRVRVVKWGNSQAVRLPKAVLEQAHMREGDELTVRVEDGRIALEPATRALTLEQLIAGITPQNLHKAQDWGKPVGNETW
jgi:antitoxin MazE